MIHAIELENFKGIAAKQRVEFSPLTLIFGANSAGKSTILQSLLYLHELIDRGSADVDRTELGGAVVELGGFNRLVHRHETERAIVLRAEFATPGGLERLGRDLASFPFPDLDDDVESGWIELTVRSRRTATFQGPIVEKLVVGVNGESEPLVWLETGASLREGDPCYARVNLGHPLIATEERAAAGVVVPPGTPLPTAPHAPADISTDWESIAVPEDVFRQAQAAPGSGYGGGAGSGAGSGGGDGIGFGDGRSLPVFAVAHSRTSALPAPGVPLRVLPFGDESPEKSEIARQVRTFLEMVVLGTTSQLAAFLRETVYVGPLRAVPPRGYLYERVGRAASWADGLAAWDALLADRGTLVERTNTWLARLGASCQIVVQELVDGRADADQLADGNVDRTARRLLLDTGVGSLVLPSEVGAGVSQVVPIVVAALDSRFGMTMMEQPEIHVHPALQVGAGDLLIEAATRDGSRRIVIAETHSEHVILRVLRRIRQTTEKELPADVMPFVKEKLSVLYVDATADGTRVRRLRVDGSGEFTDRWPKGFFAERMEELL